MSYVETVLGRIEADDLGIVHIHEHLYVDLSPVSGPTGKLDDVDGVIEELKDFKSKGGRTIVEVTNIGMGRDTNILRKISEMSGVNVVFSTGFYIEKMYPNYVFELDEEGISEVMVKEIREGVGDLKSKPWVIGEVGTSGKNFSENEKKVLRASVIAHEKTKAPIITHNSEDEGLEQVEFLMECGMDLSKVILGHQDLVPDMGYYVKVLKTGVNIAFDTFGKTHYLSEEKRVRNLVMLVKMGYLEQLFISSDITRNKYLRKNGGYGYTHIIEKIIPWLRREGLSEDEVETIMVENPKRFLTK